jgi:hypothetical protein
MPDSKFLYCTLKRYNYQAGGMERLCTFLPDHFGETSLQQGKAISLSLNYSSQPLSGFWVVERIHPFSDRNCYVKYKWKPHK